MAAKKTGSRKAGSNVTVEIGGRTHTFDSRLDKLEHLNLGKLNEQIALMAGLLRDVGEAVAMAGKELSAAKSAHEAYHASVMVSYTKEERPELSSEDQRKAAARNENKKKYGELLERIADAEYRLSVLRVWQDAYRRAAELMQTLSGNRRAEMEQYRSPGRH